MNDRVPMISVIMPSFNTPIDMLSKAIDSILEQTCKDFEFIIIDDCSTDESVDYLASLNDERIRVIRNQQNLGITKSLNVGLSYAKGRYIARMDSDDICLPERFEKQLAFMESNPEVIVCGTWIQAFGNASYVTKRIIPDKEHLRCSFLFGNSYGLCHPTAFFRADALRQNRISYDENLPTAQDYGMWVACAEYGSIANVEEVLLNYRVHNSQVSIAKKQLQIQCALRVQTSVLHRLMPDAAEDEAQAHMQMCRERKPTRKLCDWINTLKEANNVALAFNPQIFNEVADDLLKQKFNGFARVAKTPKEILDLVFCCPRALRKSVLKTLFARITRTKNQ